MSKGAGIPPRIIKEAQRLQKEPVEGISAGPRENNLRHFDVMITGPEDTPYEGKLE